MNELVDIFKRISAGRLAAMFIVSAVMLGAFIYLISEANKPAFSPLFTNLSYEDSSAVIDELESKGIPFELRADGSTILVPQENLLKLRLDMAKAGLPVGQAVGFEIFDKSDMLGSTSFVQNVNKVRAIEGELTRTIMALRGVKLARVHVVMPERTLFNRDQPKPTASVVIKKTGGFSPSQVSAIQYLVASAIAKMSPENVTIVDENGNLLSAQNGATGVNAMSGLMDSRAEQAEQKLARKVETMVEQVVGVGKARANVNVEYDQVSVTTQSEEFDPASQVVRSQESQEESSASNESSANDGVTIANELPRDAQGGDGGASRSDQSNKAKEVVNYEISRKTMTAVKQAGEIKRISLALVVDGAYEVNEAGETVYVERSEEEMKRITALARSAIGYQNDRGDVVEVINLKFAPLKALEIGEEPSLIDQMLNLSKDDIIRLSEQGVILFLGLILLLFAIRPLMRKATAPDAAVAANLTGTSGGMHLNEDQLATLAAAARDVENEKAAAAGLDKEEPADLEAQAYDGLNNLVKDAHLAGRVHAETVAKVNELVKNNPGEALVILRQWMASDQLNNLAKPSQVKAA